MIHTLKIENLFTKCKGVTRAALHSQLLSMKYTMHITDLNNTVHITDLKKLNLLKLDYRDLFSGSS